MSKRNRIVIDLNQQAPPGSPAYSRPASRGRGVGRILAVIAALLVVVLLGVIAGGFFWWQNYKTKPGYSMALLIDAAQRKDNAEIDRLLDMDKITEGFVGQVRQRVGTFTNTVGGPSAAQLDRAASLITPKLKQILHDQLPAEIARLSENASGKPFPIIAIAIPYVVDIKEQGDTARGTAKVKDETAVLVMQKQSSGGWRIVGVEDDRLVNIIADSVRKDLLSPGTSWQDEAQKQLKDLKIPLLTP